MSGIENHDEVAAMIRKILREDVEFRRRALLIDAALQGNQSGFKRDERGENRAETRPVREHVRALRRGVQSLRVQAQGFFVKIVKFHAAKGRSSNDR